MMYNKSSHLSTVDIDNDGFCMIVKVRGPQINLYAYISICLSVCHLQRQRDIYL
jgi:hypothetical protein